MFRCICSALLCRFATRCLHQASQTQRLNLSPATLSRFTTITLNHYTADDIQRLLHQQLTAQLCCPGGGGKERGASPSEVQGLLTMLLSLKATLEQELKGVEVNMRQLLRCVQFVAAHTTSASWTARLLVGFRWLVLDAYQPDPEKQLQLAGKWLLDQPGDSLSGDAEIEQLVEAAFQLPDAPELQDAGTLLQALPTGHVQLAYTGVAALAAPAAAADLDDGSRVGQLPMLADRLGLSCTQSLVSNMARVLAASTVQGPLLLEGPPGIGKTAVVQQVAAVLGFSCERINFSANTTLDQLLGSFVPQMIDGQRVFAWQDGVLVRAVRQGKWLLLDEINLAPPEVLAAIAPLFDR